RFMTGASKALAPLVGYALLAAVALVSSRPVRRARMRRDPRAMSTRQALQSNESPNDHGAAADRNWWALTKQTGIQWLGHKDARLGAALAYYSVFSIGPLIVIAVAIAGLLFGQDAVRGEV